MLDVSGRRGRVVGAGVCLGALLLALLIGLICARAALGRTQSWSFPIDDAYIYANYALSADAGHWFEYNPGEKSGGVTGPGWLVLLRLVYPLTAPFGPAVSAWAPQGVQSAEPDLAVTAGRLYLTAYSLGALLFATAGAATAWLAYLVYAPPAERNSGARAPLFAGPAGAAALLAGLLLLTDQQAIWGAFSGLELPLSFALAPLALATLLNDTQRGKLRASLILAFLLPWARPELIVFALAGTVWLLLPGAGRALRRRIVQAVGYGAAALGGLAALELVYLLATGRPLPSSFYAKVSGLRLDRAFDALHEWQLAGRWEPFTLLVLAILGSALLLLAGRRNGAWRNSLLLVMSTFGFLAAMMLALRWFGQLDRYILPLHPTALILVAGILPGGAALLRLPLDRWRSRVWAWAAGGLLAAFTLVQVLGLRVWAASDYALYVQNIEQAHVAPALWLAQNSPPDAVIAAEPIGAVHLFARRPTVDIVGLTTPAALGTYGDWASTEALLRERGAQFLLYYPRWWPNSLPPAWATPLQTYQIADNAIAGDGEIAVYGLFGR